MLRLRKKQPHLDSIEAYACYCNCPTAACVACNCSCIPDDYYQDNWNSDYSTEYGWQVMNQIYSGRRW